MFVDCTASNSALKSRDQDECSSQHWLFNCCDWRGLCHTEIPYLPFTGLEKYAGVLWGRALKDCSCLKDLPSKRRRAHIKDPTAADPVGLVDGALTTNWSLPVYHV